MCITVIEWAFQLQFQLTMAAPLTMEMGHKSRQIKTPSAHCIPGTMCPSAYPQRHTGDRWALQSNNINHIYRSNRHGRMAACTRALTRSHAPQTENMWLGPYLVAWVALSRVVESEDQLLWSLYPNLPSWCVSVHNGRKKLSVTMSGRDEAHHHRLLMRDHANVSFLKWYFANHVLGPTSDRTELSVQPATLFSPLFNGPHCFVFVFIMSQKARVSHLRPQQNPRLLLQNIHWLTDPSLLSSSLFHFLPNHITFAPVLLRDSTWEFFTLSLIRS